MIELRTRARLEYRDFAMHVVTIACHLVGDEGGEVAPEFEQHVLSAFGEAFNNVVVHAYPEGDGELRVQFEPRRDGITIRVFDYGVGFDADEVKAPNLEELPTSGLGLFIIRSFMDDFAYLPGRGASPNVLTLAKRLPTGDGARTAA